MCCRRFVVGGVRRRGLGCSFLLLGWKGVVVGEGGGVRGSSVVLGSDI